MINSSPEVSCIVTWTKLAAVSCQRRQKRIDTTSSVSNIRGSLRLVCSTQMPALTNSTSAACCAGAPLGSVRTCAQRRIRRIPFPYSRRAAIGSFRPARKASAEDNARIVNETPARGRSSAHRSLAQWQEAASSGMGSRQPRLACVIIDRRRVEWTDFGAMLMAFEGWQFRLELLDPSNEA